MAVVAETQMQLLELNAHLHPKLGIEVRQRLVKQEHAGGWRTMARPNATRWRWPAGEELARLWRVSSSPMPRMSGRLPHAFCQSRAFSNLRIFRPNAMLSYTLMCG